MHHVIIITTSQGHYAIPYVQFGLPQCVRAAATRPPHTPLTTDERQHAYNIIHNLLAGWGGQDRVVGDILDVTIAKADSHSPVMGR